MATNEVATGEPAKVFTGIRDIPIYAGESSTGNRMPGGPYRSAELIAIGMIMAPALWWFRTQEDAGFGVLGGAAVAALVVTVILRKILPTRRPSLAARTVFVMNTLLPKHIRAARPDTGGSHVSRR